MTVTVDVKDEYDSDDMKVERAADGRLVHIGKTLTAERTERGVDRLPRLPRRGGGAVPRGGAAGHAHARRRQSLVPEGHRHPRRQRQGRHLSIEGLAWAEVDYLNDIEDATALTDSWA